MLLQIQVRRFAIRAAAGLALISLAGCNAFKKDKRNDTPGDVARTGPSSVQVEKKIPKAEESFYFCPIEPVLYDKDPTGGLAALATVLNYWDTESSESVLAEKYPLGEDPNYEMLSLRRIAIDEGLMAFALTMKQQPLDQVGEQLEHGRPVIVPLLNDGETFFGAPVEELDQYASIRHRDRPDLTGTPDRFVVVFGQSDKQFLVLDPTFGVISVDKETFGKEWEKKKYSALLCSSF